jgi:hypothetical protein
VGAVSAKLLFWYEPNTKGTLYTWLDRFCSYFGVVPVIIDCLGAFDHGADKTPIAFSTMCEARAAFSDHQWIFLHPDGGVILDELEHPAEPVIYALGSNITGFGCSVGDLPADAEKVRLRDPEVIWDYQVAQMVLYDRRLYLDGRRV